MPKGKAKSKWNNKTESCDYENNSWCDLPKGKRCEDCIYVKDGSKACMVKI